MERPVISPISTTDNHASRPFSAMSSSAMARLGAGLPSPPLSPQQDHSFSKRSSVTLPFSSTLPSITVSDTDQLHANGDHNDDHIHDSIHDSKRPLLPSQLRKHHESHKLLSQQQQQQQHQEENPSSSSLSSPSLPNQQPRFTFHMSKHYSDDYDSDDDNNSEDQTKTNPLVTQQTASTSTQLSSTPKTPATAASLCAVTGHSLVRAKSYSQFETSRKSITSPTAIAAVVDTTLNTTYSYPSIPATFPQPHTAAHGHQHLLGHSDMSTRDWVKMQSRINELEMQVSHVSRANQLLNQELDKVNSHLMRLTSNDLDDHHGQGGGETWRREYEFLVDQVELMHRQLQLAQSPQYQYQLLMQSQQIQQHQYHNQSQSQSQSPSTMVPAVDQTEISRQLHSSVRELTQSLRSWQTAFQEAEEKYRRKCEGERALKQTLQERESQLSALVSKLSNYERDFQQSIAGYTHQIDTLLTRPAMTEMNTKCSHQDTHTTNIHMDTDNANSGVSLDMPGTFPQQSDDTPEGDPFSVLSWAALLATYMLS